VTATHDAEGATPDRNPDEIPYVNMTVWGVPLADVFAEWHRRWKEEPEAFATWAESIAQPDEEYGPGAARTLLGIAHEMSPFGKEVAP